ncbi:MAG: efflux RND transporter periplasmic adaptor subunit [Planctomycetia bacterium]|nr:efflux RND transporter periplasmic adaptor subunit [Planctomycetia bacterium]
MPRKILRRWWLWMLAIAVVAVVAVWQARPANERVVARAAPPATGQEPGAESRRGRNRVVVVKPHPGGIQRTSNQPGSIEAFNFADLYAKISGYLQKQPVDIGDKVAAGQVLAEIDAPEFEQELHHAEAALAQAEAQVKQTEARVATTRAEADASQALIAQSEADLEKAKSYLSFRNIQFDRVQQLFKLKSVDKRLVDEKEEQRDAAQAAENAARAAIVTARAQAAAAQAKIAQAEADVVDAKAKVRIAESNIGRAQVFVQYTRIVSPYDGVVTKRSFHVGDFIRAAGQGGDTPLLTVARTDLMRVVVQVPERDVPFTDAGDLAVVELDALPGKKFHGKVSRVAASEDRISKSMRTEIDLKNEGNVFRDGMFGRVTIYLDKASQGVTVPSSALLRSGKGKKPSVFVVRDGKAHLVAVELGRDDGIRAEILSGVSSQNAVVARPPADLADGASVEAEEAAAAAPETTGHE